MISWHVHYLAILIAATISMMVGTVWYSPGLFGKTWSKLIGKRMEDMQENGRTGYMVSAIGALLQAFVLANVIRDVSLTTAVRGAMFGFWLWLAFIAVCAATDVVFSGRSWKLWKINAGYFLVVLVTNGALLAAWR